MLNLDNQVGLYVHVPFCERLCPYCDFAVAVRRNPDFRGYLSRVLAELDSRVAETAGRTFRTVYFGGGTPSLLPQADFEWFVAELRRRLDLTGVCEFTVEANPTSVAGKLDAWSRAGVTRVSLGVQSFDDHTLSVLGRNHDGKTAREVTRELMERAFRVSVDLIFSAPGAAPSQLDDDLEVIERLGVSHVSAYQLTIEPQTVFARKVREGEMVETTEEESARTYDRLRDSLATIGLAQYEVSSFGRDGHRSIHNQSYWKGVEYLGVGVGAHSMRRTATGVERTANSKRLRHYLEGRGTVVETLSLAEHLDELLFLGVRNAEGLDIQELSARFRGVRSAREWAMLRERLGELADEGFLQNAGDHFVPTRKGYAVADALALRLLDFGRPTNT